MMRLRFSVLTPFLLAGLTAASAQAQQAPDSKTPTAPATVASKDHLSYYTYYKTVTGETVAGVAAKFGLAESSLVRMNPYLTQYADSLPVGTLVCVPKDQAKSNTGLLARSERIATAKAKAEEEEKAAALAAAEEANKPKPKGSKTKKKAEPKVETDWPDEDEWEKLAELCTKGAPAPPEHSSMVIQGPPSRFIGSDGTVTMVPAAKPRPVHKPKKVVDNSRGELASRKGKAIHTVVMTGRSFMGVPYVWGGEDPSGFDCSGFIQYVYGKHGIHLPRTADIQFNVGKVVKRGDEKPGDLVFFETYCPGPSHVGIYLGRDYFLHASSSRGVTTDRLSSDFFGSRYLGAKRNF